MSQKPLDPYLNIVREKFVEAKDYLEGRKLFFGVVVSLVYNAVLTTLQRMVVGKKGIKSLEQMRKERKLYFDNLVSILKREGVKITNLTELEMLRDLRNKVEHEGYRPSKQEAIWAYETAKALVQDHYPRIFELREEIREVRPPTPFLHMKHKHGIPEEITKNHVLDALNEIDKLSLFTRPSRSYCLVYENRHYPPKLVISKAAKYAIGRELKSSEFLGGEGVGCANWFLRRRGFEIIECGCGGIKGRETFGHGHNQTKLELETAKACEQIHKTLSTLPKWREPSGDLPKDGIYFFYEEGETTPHTGKLRIVRVGTHGANRTLKDRLTDDHYKGNREGSIFRKHLGTALLKRSKASDFQIKEWRKGRKSRLWDKFEKTEKIIDQILRSNFSLGWCVLTI